MVSVRFEVPPEAAFDYLVDPAHRPQWQSSLRRVDDVVGEVGVGQRWVDVTHPGLRPRMETTVHDRPRRWTERGAWRSVRAELTLDFVPEDDGCRVEVRTRFSARGWQRVLLPGLVLTAPLAARGDLRRAAAVLARRGG